MGVNKDKIFFIFQPVLRYMPYKIGRFLRNYIYPWFFKRAGKNANFMEGIIIKYPSEIEIGENVTINQDCFIVGKGGLLLGHNIMIGASCKIVSSTHNAFKRGKPMDEQGMSFEKITVGNDVWVML